MYCEKCGTKNESGAKFCEKCGHKVEIPEKPPKKENKLKNKLNSLSKKRKITLAVVLLLVVVAVITLCILLNNPVKKLEDNLESYYTNYTEDRTGELEEIGKVLKSNKNNQEVLDNIKKSSSKIIDKWVKNFNTSYSNEEKLEDAYEKVTGALYDVYDYYNGLEYMLDYDTYSEYSEELSSLYSSKKDYLQGKEYESDNNEYYAYYYYQKVIEEDSYYNEAVKYIESYVSDEITRLKDEAGKVLTFADNSTNEEILDCYINQIEYLNDNKRANNVDLSTTEEYKKLYSEASKNVVTYTKKVVEGLASTKDYVKAISVIDESLKCLKDTDASEYQELDKLKEEYENLMPDSLLDKYLVSSSWGSGSSKYGKEINDKEYDSYISFQFEGETEHRTYRLNKEYKTFKTSIVIGEDWDKDFEGYIVISGDDKELYKSSKITKSSKLDADIELDVSGVDDLKIEFVTTSKASGWDNFYIYLVEPYVYK